ncbi:hypothetical protein [Bacillus xiapuensis]|uniref:Uncharacterized protein n=1 Tax=Bacillus xiapuensis TaxID=2014075 RepID=A0ABU6NA54_9BACI|nr:hypothetical protein [Bacillus xiapuensis]
MFKQLTSKLTNNYNDVPLFYVTFNLNKYKENGVKGSCDLRIHPELKDEYIKNQLNNLVVYIRENYDMEKLSK